MSQSCYHALKISAPLKGNRRNQIVSQIRILSEQLANQIAAGEVVERPASVIKELLENSLDACATRIDIHVEDSGRRLLRVADNGSGMDGDDVLLCIERHATSKIHNEAQLAAIATLGFRGEALPSIASVSWLTILSRPHNHEQGTRAEIRYGTLHNIHHDGCARGTVIEVRHLFGNMPARKKFLKSDRTENHHIEEVVRDQALAHPHIGLTLTINGRRIFDFLPDADLSKRVREVFGYQGTLLPLRLEQMATEAPEMGITDITVDGYLLLPETAPTSHGRLRILVNNRPVQDAMLRHAVNEGLQGFLMKGYQAAGALVVHISPDQIDVNVHPAKREIRFSKAEVVHRFVVHQVQAALENYQKHLRSNLFTSSKVQQHESPLFQQTAPQAASTLLLTSLTTAEPVPEWLPMDQNPGLPGAYQPEGLCLQSAIAAQAPLSNTLERCENYANLTLIGQLFSLYLLCEKDGQLIVIDQHAAHERLLYGQLLHGYLTARIPQQSLIVPIPIELTPAQAETLEHQVEELATLGMQVEPFGDTTWLIKAVPALVSQVEPGGLLREILDGLRGLARAEVDRSVPEAILELLASMACKAAVKAGNRLQPVEMLALLVQMEESTIFSHCPHGRPALKVFTVQEVQRWFHRHGG